MRHRKPFTSRSKILYFLRVQQRRIFRYIFWYTGKKIYAKKIASPLKFRLIRHRSKLIKKLGTNERENLWQKNKVKNHEITIPKITGILIYPGETFSFWKLVGKPSRKKGYLEGMELSMGKARGGIGGGICQITNLIHWMALHSPLVISERASHSFDPFPDQGRVLPYGSGAAVFYNYIDLQLYNPTNQIFQINLWFTDKLLNGEIRSNTKPKYKYHVFEKYNYFVEKGNQTFRKNEIWRDVFTKGINKKLVKQEIIYKNFVKVMYKV